MDKHTANLVMSIASVVLAIIVGAVLFFTKPDPVPPAPVEKAALTPAKLPDGAVSMANNLPGGSAGPGAGGFGGGAGGGMMGPGGPGGGMMGPGGPSMGGPRSAGGGKAMFGQPGVGSAATPPGGK